MAYQRGTGFVGLQQYLSANQEQAQRMGQDLTQQVNAEGGAAQGAIDAASQDFNQQAAAGTPTYEALPEDQNVLGAAQNFVADRVGKATYKGPTSLGGTDALSKQAAGAQQTAGLASTDAGRATLLAKGAQGQYGLGARTLDAYLAGRGGGEALQQATSKYQGLQDYLGTAKSNAAARGAKGAADAAAVREQYASLNLPGYGSAPSAPDRQRNVIQTPGTMPDPVPEERNRLFGIPLSKKKRSP